MSVRIYRSINEPIVRLQKTVSFEERWKGKDQGLITSWEVGRKLRESSPDLAKHAENGELPILGWKGGVSARVKAKKYGDLRYLAQWQGLKGEALNIDMGKEVAMTCSKGNQEVIYTADIKKWGDEKDLKEWGKNFDSSWLKTAWEEGKKLRESKPKLAKRVENGELPELKRKSSDGNSKVIKGGVIARPKKYGTLWYLSQLQGLRGKDLDIDMNKEITLICSKEKQTVTYTADKEKWSE